MGLDRLARTTVWVCVGMALLALALWPGRWRIAGGVLGGGVLIAGSAWAIRGAVDGWLGPSGEGRVSAGAGGSRALVKFFTRHAILALAAYGMMARLRLDPVAMLVGVSSLVLATGVEALRRFQRVS